MSVIEMRDVKTRINDEWSYNKDISDKITDIINSSDGRHWRSTGEIQICFVLNNRMYTIIYRKNIEITREKIVNLQDVRSAIDRRVPPRI